MTTPEKDPFAGSAGLPSISFATKDQYGNMASKPVGTRIGGTVLKAPSVQQSRNFLSKLPETWPDGNPKTSVVVDLKIDAGGEGDMALWVKKPSALFKAFQEAKGDNLVKAGDKVYVTLVGFGKPEEGKAPAKLYKVDYVPTDAFAASPSPTTTASPVAPPAPPQAPVASAEPVLSNGFTRSALLASGWSEAQIAALSPALNVPVPAPAPPAPAAPEAAQALDEKAKRIAEMSPEDRALLNLG